MTPNRPPLDGFERRLLTELNQVVTERARTTPTRAPHRWRTRLAVTGTAITAAAAAVAILTPGSETQTPDPGRSPTSARPVAYELTDLSDGTVRLTVNDYTDPAELDGLRDELNERGIPVDVMTSCGVSDLSTDNFSVYTVKEMGDGRRYIFIGEPGKSGLVVQRAEPRRVVVDLDPALLSGDERLVLSFHVDGEPGLRLGYGLRPADEPLPPVTC